MLAAFPICVTGNTTTLTPGNLGWGDTALIHKATLVVLVVGLALASSCAMAADVYVDAAATGAGNGTSWTDAYTTIQTAINAASAGDVIHVRAGVYNENVDFAGKAVTLTGVDPLDPAVVAATVIDGGDTGSVVTFNSGETSASVLSGFTIRNGNGTLVDGRRYGGGIYIGIDCKPTIRHNVITGCSADVGGGIYAKGNTPPIIGDGPTAAYPYVGTGQNVGLSVTATDDDNDTLSYTWTPLDGGSISGSGSSVNFSCPLSGVRRVRVTVDDGRGGTATGEVQVTVIGVQIQTPLPQLIAGQDAALNATVDPVIADSAEYPVTITWSLVNGPAVGTFDAAVNGTESATSITFSPTASGPGRIQVEYKVGTAAATNSVQISLYPIASSISPAYGVVGTTVAATVTGHNLARVNGISLSGTGVTGTVKDPKTEESLPVEFVISDAAAPGVRSVTLNTPEGAVSTSITFELRTPPAITANPTSLNLLTGESGTITFSIPDVAPAGGKTLSLSSSAPVVATVPATATIPEGQQSAQVSIQAVGYGQTTITANCTGYYKAQVPVTVINPPLITAVPSPLTVAQGLVEKCTLSVSNPAPAGGLVIALAGGSGLASFPASITIAESKFSASFYVTGVAQGSGTITATATGYPAANIPVNVTPARLSLFPNYLPIAAGRASSLLLSIPNPAPAGGLTVNLESSSPSNVSVPATASIVEGEKSTSIPVNGVIAGSAVVTASLTGFESATANVNVLPQFNISFLPGALFMPPGVTRQTDVVISSAAPAGGLTIALTNPSPDKVTVPESVFIPEGAFAKTITVAGLDPSGGPITISASCPGLTEGSLQVTVQPLLSLWFRGDVKPGVGTKTTGAIGLTSGNAPTEGYTVNLSSDDPSIAAVPSTVTIPGGSSWTSFDVTGVSVGSTTIRMSLTGLDDSDTVTVIQPILEWNSIGTPLYINQVDSIRVYNRVPGGTYAWGNYVYGDEYQNLTSPISVSVSSSDTGVISVPSSTSIPAGRYYGDYFNMTAVGVGTAKLTAAATGYAPVESALITVNNLAPYFRADVTVGANTNTSGAVGLSNGSAPAGGYTFSLTSDDPSIATVPDTVTIPAGSTWSQFAITGKSVGTTLIHVTAPGGFTEADTVTVVQSELTWDSVTTSLLVNQTDSVRVFNRVPGGTYAWGNNVYGDINQNLTQPVALTISGSDSAVITAPATASIPAGRYYSDYFTMTATGVGTARLTVSADSYAGVDSPDVTVTNVAPWFRADVTVGIGTKTTGAVGVNIGSAPAGGYTFKLVSDDPAIATVPDTVSISQGSTWSAFDVVGHAVGTTVIRLMTTDDPPVPIAEGTATVVQPDFTWDSVMTTLNLGQTDSVRVFSHVPGGTYAWGNYIYGDVNQSLANALTVTITSSDANVLGVPATTTIPANRYYSDYFTMTATGGGTATLTASASGYTDTISPVVTVTGVTPWFRADVTVGAGTRTTGGVGLNSGVAPAGGYTFNLVSADPSIATVPDTVTIPQNSSWVSFPIHGKVPGQTTISLSAPGGATLQHTVTVVQPTFQWDSVPASLSIGAVDSVRVYSIVPGGTYVWGNYVYNDTQQNLDQPITVNFTAANAGVIQIPASVNLPADRYYSDYVNIAAVGTGSSTLTAAASGYTSAASGLVQIVGPTLTAAVTVGAETVTPGSVSIVGGVAPTGGYTVSLTSDDPSIASVPATVTIPQGNTWTSFSVTGHAVGTTGIQMSVSGFISRNNATVVKPTFQWDNVSSSLNVGQTRSVRVYTYVPGGTYGWGTSIYGNVNQNPAADLTVSLSSENPTVLTIPASLTIPSSRYYSDYVTATAVGAGTSTLTASALGYDSVTTGTITVNATGGALPAGVGNEFVADAGVVGGISDPDAMQMSASDTPPTSTPSASSGGPTILMLPALAAISGPGQLGSSAGPVIEYNVITGNSATTGAGIAVYNCSPTVRDNILAANTASGEGGAIDIAGQHSSVTIIGDTISGNSAGSGAGGIHLSAGAASVTDCILWQNGAELAGCSAGYSCVTDLSAYPGTGNISADPAFVQTADPAAAGYYRLNAGSPCINVGSPTYAPATGETDIDGGMRIASRRVDIGADEYPDVTPPDTRITSGPSQGGTACSRPVTFWWDATDDGNLSAITYSYRLDSGVWSAWASTKYASFQDITDGTHIFEVKSTDEAGNVDPTPVSRTFTVDTIGPAISGVQSTAGRSSAIATWTTDETATSQVVYGTTTAYGSATYLDWQMVTAHSTTVSGLLPNTVYHFRVKSRDACGHETTSDDFTFTTGLDSTPPDTQIVSGPAEGAVVCSQPIAFGFSGTDDSYVAANLSYSYSVDGGAWSAWSTSSTASLSGLTAGDHQIEVKAQDPSGNTDATPAIRHFTLRLDPVAISAVNAAPGQGQCTITWTTDYPSTSQVAYGTADTYGTLSPLNGSMVTSHSVVLTGLSASTLYHFSVRSKDTCNREAASSDLTFTTPDDNGKPDTWFTSGPAEAAVVCDTSASFCWSGSDSVTPASQLIYLFKLDDGGWSQASSDTCRTFTGLAEGGHTVYVCARDTSGNLDDTPAQRSFTVDLSAGTIYNITQAAGATEATVAWQTNKPMDSIVDYGPTTAYGQTTTLNASRSTNHTVVIPGLTPETTYHYRVRSKDYCGREVAGPDRTFSTTADAAVPDTTIISGPPNNGKACDTTVTFGWVGTDNATPREELVYSYKMDEAAWSAYVADVSHEFTGLAEGLHTFMVRAKDTAGNIDSTPAVAYFYVDLTAPTITPGSINLSAKQSTCIINWRTDEPCTSQVEYGTTTSYGSLSVLDPSSVATHRITLSGLTPETTYHFRVKSNDGCKDVVSDDMTFTTTAVQPPNLRPTQLTFPATTSAHATVKVSWVIQNVGPGDAEGSWTDKLYLSEDEAIDGGDTELYSGAGTSPVPVPYTYGRNIDIVMPMKPVGVYYVILKTDTGGTLAESNETDNAIAQPIVFAAPKPLIAAPGSITLKLNPTVAAYGQFDLTNLGSEGLTGLTATVNDAAANINLNVSNVPPTLDALTNRRISFVVTANDESVLTNTPTVTFTTTEGSSATVTFNLTVIPRQPKLVADPGYISGPMIRGSQTYYECEVANTGGVPASDLRVMLPASNWLSLATPADIGTLAPGEKAKVGLSLTPPPDMSLGDYQGSFVVVGTNAGVNVSFRFTCVSTQVGGVKVMAEDEFTYFADDKPPVAGATVTIKDYTTGEVKYEGTTDAAGIWLKDNIVEANYQLEVKANKHGTYRAPLQIVAGQTKEVKAFLPRQLVSYTWTVEPIQIEDKYRVSLEATFETHVPAPVVTIEPKTQVAAVVEGHTMTYYVTVTNHGLIAAHEVEVNIGDTDSYYVVPAIRTIGELPAMSSVRVPIYIRAKADGPITDLPSAATSTMAAQAVMAAQAGVGGESVADSSTQARGVRPLSGSGGGDPSLCDILSGKVVHFVYCAGGRWETADFSISPINIALNILDAIGCVAGNVQSCLSLACGLANIDPCICFFIDPISAGGLLNAAQCLACHGMGGGGTYTGGGGDPGGGGGGGWSWGPGSISGPPAIENSVPCDPATRPQSLSDLPKPFVTTQSEPAVTVTSPSDISKYGGKEVHYKVNLVQEGTAQSDGQSSSGEGK